MTKIDKMTKMDKDEKIGKNAKIDNSNETCFGHFQTMCRGLSSDRIFSLVFKEKLGKLHFSGLNCLDKIFMHFIRNESIFYLTF